MNILLFTYVYSQNTKIYFFKANTLYDGGIRSHGP
jgi:hypothetical protein